jgi:hypothetical protein
MNHNNPPVEDGSLRTLLKRKIDEMTPGEAEARRNKQPELKRLHPLHSVDYIKAMVEHTGCYPDQDRRTGRTTVLALEYITLALKQPYQVITVRDHYPSVMCHQSLCTIIHDLACRMGLEKLYVNPQRTIICFGERP